MSQVTPARNKRKRYKEGDEIIAAYDDDEHRTRYTESDADESSSEDEESVGEPRKKQRKGGEKEKDAYYWKGRFNEASKLRSLAEDRARAAEKAKRSLQKDMGILKESKKK